MSTFILVGAVFIILLIVLSRIPGVEYLVKPLVYGVTWVFSTFMGGVSGCLLWGIKTSWRSRTVSASCLASASPGGSVVRVCSVARAHATASARVVKVLVCKRSSNRTLPAIL